MILNDRCDKWLVGLVFILCSSVRLTRCDPGCVWKVGSEESTFGEQLFRAIFFPPFGIDIDLPCNPCTETQLSNAISVCKNQDTSLCRFDESSFGIPVTTLFVTIVGLSLLATKHRWKNKTRRENVMWKILGTSKLPVSTKNERRKFRLALDNAKKDSLRIIQGTKTFKLSKQMCEFIRRSVDDPIRDTPGLNQGSQMIYEYETRFSDLTRDDLFTTRHVCKLHLGGQQLNTRNLYRERFQEIREEINLALKDAKRTKSQGEIVDNTHIENRTNQMPSRDHGDASSIGPPRASSSMISVTDSDVSDAFLAEDVSQDQAYIFDASFEYDSLDLDEIFEETQTADESMELPSITLSILNSSIFDTTFDVSDFQKSFTYYGNDMVSVYQFAAVVATKKLLDKARGYAQGLRQALSHDDILQSLPEDELSSHLNQPD